MIADTKKTARLAPPIVRRISEGGGQRQSAECYIGLSASGERNETESDPTLWLYRDRTVALLRRYLRLSIEVGKLPSLLGKEFFRTRVTNYRTSTFEDAVIFVHDVDRSLEALPDLDKTLIGMIVLQEYTQHEAAQVLGYGHRTIARYYLEALDRVSEIFLLRQILTRLPSGDAAEKCCQEGKINATLLSDSLQGE
jgi:DNA-directed RNA polymerase specialized sigma24 family protein